MKKTISIITPCYNEEEGIRDCYEAVQGIHQEYLANYDLEHIFCDNASTDSTVKILREMAKENAQVKLILNARNFGPMRSHFNGVRSATGDLILLFLPADLQDPPELLPDFVKLWEQGYEIIYGVRTNREESFLMVAVRKLYYRILTKISYVDMPPDVGEFQLVDRKVLEAIKEFDDAYPFVRAMTFECGFKQVAVPYTWKARSKGVSKNRLMSLIDQGLNGLISFSTAPMRFALTCGLILAIVSMGFAFVNVVYSLATERVLPTGTPLLITALFFFSGVQLFFIGFLGEYVLAIYNQVRKRPLVVERERVNFEKADT
jgi:polyisoprenyl-phosphate glycosyltransferase